MGKKKKVNEESSVITSDDPTNNPSKKRQPRQQSTVSKSLGSGAKRHMVVCMELEKAIRKGYENKKGIIAEFTRYADYQGALRFVVGVASNYVLAKQVQNYQIQPVDKNFIDRVWSAIEVWKGNPELAKKRGFSDSVYYEVGCFLEETGIDTSVLVEKCPFDLRQRTSDDIRVAYVSHIANNFEARVRAHARHIVSNVNELVRQFPNIKDRVPIVNQIVNIILIHNDIISIPVEIEHNNEVIKFIEKGKECVLTLINAASEKGPKPLSYALKSHTHLAIPFLAWMSEYASEKNNQICEILEGAKCMPRLVRKAYIPAQLKKEKCSVPPKAFALLPYFNLQRCFVDYCTTEVKTLFGKSVTMEQIQEELFNLDCVPQVKNNSVKLLGFRTDGYTLGAKFIALAVTRPYSPNTDHLAESGYDLPNPKNGGVDVLNTFRGIYRITEKRYDNYILDPAKKSQILAITVDPGVKKPVSVRNVSLDKADSAQDIKDNSTTWELTSDEYRKMSGYDIVRNRHQLRCYKNKKYLTALRDLRQCIKKTSVLTRIVEYGKCIATHFPVLVKEKLHRQRAKAKRVHQKQFQSALAIVGNKITGKTREHKYVAVGTPKQKRVVFYGDGHFKTPRGCVSVPWKKLAHNVACKALTFATSEHRTSCACPNCECGTMEDIHKGSRMRSCNSSNLMSDSKCVFSSLVVDRDELATISLARIAHDALIEQSRPKQFRNRQRPVSDDAVQRSSRKKGTLSKGKAKTFSDNSECV